MFLVEAPSFKFYWIGGTTKYLIALKLWKRPTSSCKSFRYSKCSVEAPSLKFYWIGGTTKYMVNFKIIILGPIPFSFLLVFLYQPMIVNLVLVRTHFVQHWYFWWLHQVKYFLFINKRLLVWYWWEHQIIHVQHWYFFNWWNHQV